MNKFTVEQTAILTRHRAVGYFIAANQIDAGYTSHEPKYFLFCHAIELALKAYLLVNGYSEKKCRDIGHDLAAALEFAIPYGLSMSDFQKGIIASLSREHNRPFSFRYFNAEGWAAPSFENVSACCRHLILEIQPSVFAANQLLVRDDHIALVR